MQVFYKEILEKLGVDKVLGPYETQPWSNYDEDNGITCSAEVRADPDGNGIEAEIQIMHDTPSTSKPAMAQICLMRAQPGGASGMWDIKSMRVKGEPFGEDVYNWQEKSCNFFFAVVRELERGKIPDIDKLIERELHARERAGDQRGSGGGKSPKIRANQLLDMKQKGGF